MAVDRSPCPCCNGQRCKVCRGSGVVSEEAFCAWRDANRRELELRRGLAPDKGVVDRLRNRLKALRVVHRTCTAEMEDLSLAIQEFERLERLSEVPDPDGCTEQSAT